ncbi:MAG: chemotaxis protein CheW [Pseudomonadota bacterium]
MKNEDHALGKSCAEEIDWAQVHRSLEATREKIERAWSPSPEERDAIFRERARFLNRVQEAQAPPEDIIEVVEFHLAQEMYGIESSYVRVVCHLKDFAPLPCTPPFVLGIVNVRGKIISIVNLKKFFELPEVGLTDMSKAIILKRGNMEFSILADAVAGVRRIHLKDMQPSILTLTGIRADYLRGVTKERLIVLDAAKILSDPKIVVHEEVGKSVNR